MFGCNYRHQHSEIDVFSPCITVPCSAQTWYLTPAETRGGNPLVYRVDGHGLLEVGFWSIQDGVIVDVPAEDEAELRAIAEIYARC